MPFGTTSTVAVAVSEPDFAVIVIVLIDGSRPVERVAVTLPATVTVSPTANAPEDADNEIGTFDNKLLLASTAMAVIVAVVEPSDKIAEALELTAILSAVKAPAPSTVIAML